MHFVFGQKVRTNAWDLNSSMEPGCAFRTFSAIGAAFRDFMIVEPCLEPGLSKIYLIRSAPGKELKREAVETFVLGSLIRTDMLLGFVLYPIYSPVTFHW